MRIKKNIALVAHDNLKKSLVEWVEKHAQVLVCEKLICTGTTGRLVKEMFESKFPDTCPEITLLKSGPLGGDQQLGAKISEGEVDIVIFLTDPMTPQPHDVDVKALMRIAVIYNIPLACNISTADFIITSDLFKKDYRQKLEDYSIYLSRTI